MPAHLQGLKGTLSRQKDFEGVLQALDHAQTIAGKKALAPLAADAPEPVRLERKTLLDGINGVPAKPSDYGITKPDKMPAQQWNQELADGFAAWAHKNSVAPGSVKELMGLQFGLVEKQLIAQAQGEATFWADQQKTFEATIARDNIPGDRAQALVEKGAIAMGLNLEDEQTKTFFKGATARLMAMKYAIATGEDKVVEGGLPDGGKDYGAQAQDIQRNPANPEYAIYHNRENKYSRDQQAAVVQKVNGWLMQADAKKVVARNRS